MTDSASTVAPRSRGKTIVFYSISLGFLLLLVECGLKFFDPEQIMVREDDTEMVYAFYPERTGIAATPEYRVEVRTDQDGLRGCPAIGPANTATGSGRVLILGDSFAEGWGIPCEKTFAGLLDRRADFAVANGGLHGGSPGYYILRYRILKKIEHGTLVIQVFDNDLDDLDKFAPFVIRDANGSLESGRAAGLGPIPPGAFTRFLKNRGLYRAVKRIYYGVRGRPLPIKYYRPGREPAGPVLTHEQAIQKFGAPAPLKDAEVDYGGQFAFYKFKNRDEFLDDPLWGTRYERMHRNLVQLFAEARADNPDRKLVLVYIPAREVFAPGGILGQGPDRPLTVAELRAGNLFYQMLRRLADENEVSLVDGQEIFHGGAARLYFPGDAHLNVAGHARVAEALLATIAP